MSRKDYRAIANTIRNLTSLSITDRDRLIDDLAHMFKQDNSAFSYAKFHVACVTEE